MLAHQIAQHQYDDDERRKQHQQYDCYDEKGYEHSKDASHDAQRFERERLQPGKRVIVVVGVMADCGHRGHGLIFVECVVGGARRVGESLNAFVVGIGFSDSCGHRVIRGYGVMTMTRLSVDAQGAQCEHQCKGDEFLFHIHFFLFYFSTFPLSFQSFFHPFDAIDGE